MHVEVIDREQRLTALTILLVVVADALTGDLRDGRLVHIKEKGKPNSGNNRETAIVPS